MYIVVILTWHTQDIAVEADQVNQEAFEVALSADLGNLVSKEIREPRKPIALERPPPDAAVNRKPARQQVWI